MPVLCLREEGIAKGVPRSEGRCMRACCRTDRAVLILIASVKVEGPQNLLSEGNEQIMASDYPPNLKQWRFESEARRALLGLRDRPTKPSKYCMRSAVGSETTRLLGHNCMLVSLGLATDGIGPRTALSRFPCTECRLGSKEARSCQQSAASFFASRRNILLHSQSLTLCRSAFGASARVLLECPATGCS